MNTPFQWTKQIASHLGGVRNPLAVSWPARIKDRGGVRAQFHHVIDIAPTIYEAVGIRFPDILNGVAQKPLEGVSMVYSFDSADRAGPPPDAVLRDVHQPRHLPRWLVGGLAHQHSVGRHSRPADPDTATWELYNLDEDFSQANDLAAKNPAKLRELQEMWWTEAAALQRAAARRPQDRAPERRSCRGARR